MHIIGITGGVGAGKSEVLSYIREKYNCRVILADEVGHLVKMPGQRCYEQLKELLGEEVLLPDKSIDKAKMAEMIFKDVQLLKQVNALIHPAVQDFLLEKLSAARENPEIELFFVEAALLIEAGYGELVDEMWYIYAEKEVRRARLKASRGYSDAKITSIMLQQLTEERFRMSCDFVIDNSGLLTSSYRQIDKKLEAFTWQE